MTHQNSPRPLCGIILMAGLLVFGVSSPGWAAAAAASPWDITQIGLAWQVPEMAGAVVRTGIPYDSGPGEPQTMDLYYPADAAPGAPAGAVLFVNGVGDPPGEPLRSWAIYRDWARAVTARGLVGIVYGAEAGHTRENLAAIFAHLRRHGRELGVDPERLGLFACSANVTAGLPFSMSDAAAPLRAAVFYYGNAAVDSIRADLPVFYVRAQRDGPGLNQGIDRIWQRAREAQVPWSMVVGRNLPHAFDALDVGEGSRAIIQETLDFYVAHLRPLPPAPPDPVERRVNAAIYAQDYATAARLLEPEYHGGDSHPDITRLLLHCYKNLRDTDRGLPLAEDAVRRYPDVANLWSSRGALLLAAGRPADAADSFERALARGAGDFVTYNQVIQAHLAAGDPAAAVRQGEAAARLFPTASAIHYNLACAHARNHEPGPALDALSAAVRAGYRDRAAIEADPDLEALRSDARFREIMAGLAE